jgi:hypothetical protein
MEDTCYLVVSEDGVQKMNKQRKPSLKSGQRGFLLEVEVPDSFFDQAFPKVSIEMDESQVIEPDVDVQVQENREWMVQTIWDQVGSMEQQTRDALADRLDDRMSYLDYLIQSESVLRDASYSDLAVILEVLQNFDSPFNA